MASSRVRTEVVSCPDGGTKSASGLGFPPNGAVTSDLFKRKKSVLPGGSGFLMHRVGEPLCARADEQTCRVGRDSVFEPGPPPSGPPAPPPTPHPRTALPVFLSVSSVQFYLTCSRRGPKRLSANDISAQC